MRAPILPAPRMRTFCIKSPDSPTIAPAAGQPAMRDSCFEGRDSDETRAGRHTQFLLHRKDSRYDRRMNAALQALQWSPTSWTERPASQQPAYRDPVALARAVEALARLPPIVVSWEVEALKKQIAEAQRGER